MSAVNRFSSYDGKMLSEFEHMPSLSYYCHNYYKGFGNDILYAESDDDNRTYYKIDGDDRWFAESLSSEGNIIHVFCNEYDLDVPTITYQPFTQKFADECAGQYAQIELEVPKDILCPEEY